MPNVTKHTTNNLVTVSYPVREAQLEITHAEHALILMFSHEKDKMIKFIRAQCNLSLYDAKQVIDTVIASAEVETEVQLQNSAAETEVNWSTIPVGTVVYVRDREDDPWRRREFVKYSNYSCLPFQCRESSSGIVLCWKYAKLLTN